MKKRNGTARTALKPSFKLAMVLVAFFVWLAGATYAESLESKKSGTTVFVLMLCLLIGGIGALTPRFAFLRTFAFRWDAPSEVVAVKSRWIVAYAIVAAATYYAIR
jgi:hypothetical protein